jgi:lipopolysaccharide/colanic/teichoic acid biosynthesis glycosyltransferase
MAAVSVLIRLDSRGPVIFKATRIGKDGRPFTIFKFRTMGVDAEARLASLASSNVGGHRFIRIPDDPRITRVGRVLRKAALDELPQLVNVIRGEMSLVGPRPQDPNEVELYTDEERRRLCVRPGLTGLWQVKAWNTSTFDDWIRFDREYLDRQSLWLDLRILAETPWALMRRFRGRGKNPSGRRLTEGR